MLVRLSYTAIATLVAVAAAWVIALPGAAEVIPPPPTDRDEYRVDLDPYYHYELSESYHQRLAYRAVRKGRGWQVQEVVRTRLNGATEWREGWLARSIIIYGDEAYERARELVDLYVRWAIAQRPSALKLQLDGHRVAAAVEGESVEEPSAAQVNPPRRGTMALFSGYSNGARSVGARGDATDAQPETLVSNLDQPSIPGQWADSDHLQEFTTGSWPHGYSVSAVAIEFTFHGESPYVGEFEIVIRRATAGGQPTGPVLGTFAKSGELTAGVNTFSLEGSDDLILEPSTRYVVIFDLYAPWGQSTTNSSVRISATNSNAEDDGSDPTWSIAHVSRGRIPYQTGTFNSPTPGTALQIALYGYAPFGRTIGDWTAQGGNYVYALECGGTEYPPHAAFRANPKGGGGVGPYDTYFCNLDTGKWVTGRHYQMGVDYSRTEDLISVGDDDYNEKCRYSKPGYQVITDENGNYVRDANGNLQYKVYRGANYDPITGGCTQRGLD